MHPSREVCIIQKAYACPNPMDEDFVEAWESGLKEEFLNDRKALACLLPETQNLNMVMWR